MYLQTPLARETVTPNSLLPMVMTRATASYPSTPDLVKHLDGLYGASIGYDVSRRGEIHSLLFKLDMVADAYLPGETDLLDRGLLTLAEVILHPATQENGFKADFVSQEKQNLREMISGLINDKRRYAVNRCREIMCEGEPFALYHLGNVEDLDTITPQSLLGHWDKVLRQAAIQMFVVGDVEPRHVAELVQRHFAFPEGGVRTIPVTTVKHGTGSVRRIEEKQPVNQGVLVMGMRTGITGSDEQYFPMVVANGVLGAFPHSKLFVNVREKNSLAYYAYSSIEAIKGIGLIYAGIDFDNYEQAVEICLAQIEEMKKGQVSDNEMESTIKAMVNDALAAQDTPGRMVEDYLAGMITGKPLTTSERISGYQSVTKEQVAMVADKFNVETIYFLTKEES